MTSDWLLISSCSTRHLQSGYYVWPLCSFSCDADPAALAKYVVALLRKEKPKAALRVLCIDQLEVFLAKGKDVMILGAQWFHNIGLLSPFLCSETTAFVEKLFRCLESESYLKGEDPPPQSPPTPTKPAASSAPLARSSTLPSPSPGMSKSEGIDRRQSEDRHKEVSEVFEMAPGLLPQALEPGTDCMWYGLCVTDIDCM